MSKPTDNFWNGLGWGLVWIGLLGGIALVIWAVNHFGNQDERLCIQQHGQWVLKNESDVLYYACDYGAKK